MEFMTYLTLTGNKNTSQRETQLKGHLVENSRFENTFVNKGY